jgi:hypothetical protein
MCNITPKVGRVEDNDFVWYLFGRKIPVGSFGFSGISIMCNGGHNTGE